VSKIIIAETANGIGSKVAEELEEFSRICTQESGKFTIAMSGGSMPKLLANLVGKDINFEKWHVFFVDERCVPLDDDESNYKACLEHLFSKVPIPEGQIHPIDFSQGSPEAIGEEYAEQLRSLWGTEPPAFDAILLGVGPDGHTASLFP
ncbi:unnamed protein product, partial [Heterosigma akashiwo]